MTSDGVDGTAADDQARVTPRDRARGTHASSVMTNASHRAISGSHTPILPPAGVLPSSLRRERQVAFALRSTTDLMDASLIRGADSAAGRACAGLYPRVRTPRHPPKGSR
jgi:hypothetical protein